MHISSIVVLSLVLTVCFGQSITLNVTPITNATVAISWQTDFTERVVFTIFDEIKPLATTTDLFFEYKIEPNYPYEFVVCANVTSFGEICSLPFDFSLQRSSNAKEIIAADSDTLIFVFAAFGGTSSEKNYYIQSLGFQDGVGKWLNVAVEKAEENETPNTFYTISFPTKPGFSKFYRINRSPFISSAFWYASPPRFYSSAVIPPPKNSITSVAFTPTTSNTLRLSSSSSMLLDFDLENQFPCEPISARLLFEVSVSASTYGDGFIRVFDNNSPNSSNPLFYLSNTVTQYTAPISTFVINLDRTLPLGEDIFSFLDSCNSGDACELNLQLIESSLDTTIIVNNLSSITLEVSFENIDPTPVLKPLITVAPNVNNNCLNLQQNPISSRYFYFSTPINLAIQQSETLFNINATISGTWNSGIISAGISSGAIGSKDVSSTPNVFTLQSDYSLKEGGFPAVNGVNTFYIIYENINDEPASSICITSVSISYSVMRTQAIPCTPNGFPTQTRTPTPTPTPNNSGISNTPSRSPSVVSTQSNTASTTPFASPSSFQSVNIAPPIPVVSTTFSNTPSRTKLPSSGNAGSASPSPTRSRNSGNVQPTPQIQPTKAPATQNPINVVDSDGNVVVEITFETDNPGETLIVSPIDVPANAVGSNAVNSLPVSLILLDAFGFEIQPSAPVRICLDSDADEDKSCLGFLNEDFSPPRWECQDTCLERNDDNLLCGDTDHFTSFAVLFSGTGNGCGSNDDLIFSEAWQDGVLIGSVSAAFLICLLCFTVLLAATPCGSRIVRGGEGHRVHKLRDNTELTGVDQNTSAV